MILELRTKQGLSQDELAEKIMVTRQAVSALGEWRNRAEYGYVKAAVESI